MKGDGPVLDRKDPRTVIVKRANTYKFDRDFPVRNAKRLVQLIAESQAEDQAQKKSASEAK